VELTKKRAKNKFTNNNYFPLVVKRKKEVCELLTTHSFAHCTNVPSADFNEKH
jgi:hypothetical protein